MLLMAEKGIRRGICINIYQYAKADNKYMEDYDKNKNYHIFTIDMLIIYMDEQCRKSSQ